MYADDTEICITLYHYGTIDSQSKHLEQINNWVCQLKKKKISWSLSQINQAAAADSESCCLCLQQSGALHFSS